MLSLRDIPFYIYPDALKDPKDRKQIFSNIQIQEQALEILKLSKQDKYLGIHIYAFVIYGMIDLENKTTPTWIYPSVPYSIEAELLKSKEALYIDSKGKNRVVKAKPTLTGVVHLEARDLALKSDEKKLLEQYKPTHEFGLALKSFDNNYLGLRTSSTMQFTIHKIHPLAYYSYFIDPKSFKFSEDKECFYHNSDSRYEHSRIWFLRRQLDPEITDILYIKIKNVLAQSDYDLNNYIDDENVREAISSWTDKTQAQLSDWLLTTIYTLAIWPNNLYDSTLNPDSSEQTLSIVFQKAKKFEIPLNLNLIPTAYSDQTHIPAIMFAAKSNNFNVMKLLINNGADVMITTPNQKTVSDYIEQESLLKILNIFEEDNLIQQLKIALDKQDTDSAKLILAKVESKLQYIAPVADIIFFLSEAITVGGLKKSLDLPFINTCIKDLEIRVKDALKITPLITTLNNLHSALINNEIKEFQNAVLNLQGESIELEHIILKGMNLLELGLENYKKHRDPTMIKELLSLTKIKLTELEKVLLEDLLVALIDKNIENLREAFMNMQKYKKNFNSLSLYGTKILELVVKIDHEDIFLEFLNSCNEIDAMVKNQFLAYLVEHNKISNVKILLEHKYFDEVDVNTTLYGENVPLLSVAVKYDNAEMINLLLDYKIDVTKKDSNNKSPIDYKLPFILSKDRKKDDLAHDLAFIKKLIKQGATVPEQYLMKMIQQKDILTITNEILRNLTESRNFLSIKVAINWIKNLIEKRVLALDELDENEKIIFHSIVIQAAKENNLEILRMVEVLSLNVIDTNGISLIQHAYKNSHADAFNYLLINSNPFLNLYETNDIEFMTVLLSHISDQNSQPYKDTFLAIIADKDLVKATLLLSSKFESKTLEKLKSHLEFVIENKLTDETIEGIKSQLNESDSEIIINFCNKVYNIHQISLHKINTVSVTRSALSMFSVSPEEGQSSENSDNKEDTYSPKQSS